MKEKLLLIVQPLPKAVYAADLEEFRHSLYCKEVSPVLIHDKPPCTNQCMWCGIWTPLPTPPIIAIASTQQPLFQQLQACDKTVDALLEVCLCQVASEQETATDDTRTPLLEEHVVATGNVGELGNQPTADAITSKSAVAVSTDPNNGSLNNGELGNQPTVDAITSTTAVAACTDLYGELGNQPTVATFAAVAATADPANISFPQSIKSPSVSKTPPFSISDVSLKTSTMKKYSFKRTVGLSKKPESLQTPSPQQYATDETTGECKVQ